MKIRKNTVSKHIKVGGSINYLCDLSRIRIVELFRMILLSSSGPGFSTFIAVFY